MIYLDTSVALARLLADDRVPPESLCDETLVSSRLVQHETWTRIDARLAAAQHLGVEFARKPPASAR